MKKNIGRPKTFDNDEVVKIAMHYFWEHGYDDACLDDLLLAMGIKKSSFYHTFRSKKELFSLTLELYRKETFASLVELKNKIGAKKTLLTLATSTIEELKTRGKVKGCLLMSSGQECYGKYPDLSRQIALEFSTFVDFFESLIKEAKDRKQIINSLGPNAIAKRYLTTLNGLYTIIQAGANDETVEEVMVFIEELLA
jgi:TetR/AcrR family transcriptional repressor of nem operon